MRPGSGTVQLYCIDCKRALPAGVTTRCVPCAEVKAEHQRQLDKKKRDQEAEDRRIQQLNECTIKVVYGDNLKRAWYEAHAHRPNGGPVLGLVGQSPQFRPKFERVKEHDDSDGTWGWCWVDRLVETKDSRAAKASLEKHLFNNGWRQRKYGGWIYDPTMPSEPREASGHGESKGLWAKLFG